MVDKCDATFLATARMAGRFTLFHPVCSTLTAEAFGIWQSISVNIVSYHDIFCLVLYCVHHSLKCCIPPSLYAAYINMQLC